MLLISLIYQRLQIVTTCFVIVNSCSVGWFGPQCQYKCHCYQTGCNEKGSCLSKFCSLGWLADKCQNEDILRLPTTTVAGDPSDIPMDWFMDLTIYTCNRHVNLKSIIVTFKHLQIFTWLYIIAKSKTSAENLDVQFQTEEGSPKIECKDKYVLDYGYGHIEIRCNVPDPIIRVIVSGSQLINICQIFINGGRNFALKRDTTDDENTQDGLLSTSHLAVDGNTSPLIQDGSCSNRLQTWKLDLKKEFRITRILIYNRQDYGDRIHNFTIYGYNEKEKVVFQYQDPGSESLPVYHIVNKNWKHAMKTIVIKSSSVQEALSLCEVEAYGECPPDSAGMECESCQDVCYLGACNRYSKCLFGCIGTSNPPDCTKKCGSQKWGINCNESCSERCYGLTCNNLRGSCTEGCNGYSDPPKCTTECSPQTWGLDCKQSCSEICYNSICDRLTGSCTEGCNGYSDPPKCTTECKPGTWGRDCKSTCSIFCRRGTYCDRLTGYCEEGCNNGYDNFPQCNECFPGKWGLNCQYECIQCDNGSCDQIDSRCVPRVGSSQYLDPSGGCKEGFYGKNCSFLCSENCKERKCDPVDGFCFQCKPGYHGILCDKDDHKDISQLQMYSVRDKIKFIIIGLGVGFGAVSLLVCVMCVVRMVRRKTPV